MKKRLIEKNNRVSVIIPCFNCEKTINDTLLCLEHQTKLPFEVICINDGSSDSTLSLLQSFAKNTCLNVKIINKSNSGVSDSRNIGINESDGEILLFLDSDDLFCENLVEYFSSLFEDGFDCVFGRYTRNINSLGLCKGYKSISQKKAMVLFTTKKEKYHTCAFAYSKSIIVDNNLHFYSAFKYGEDWNFTSKYIGYCHRIALISSNVYYYSINSNSAMHSLNYHMVDSVYSAEDVSAFFANTNVYYSKLFDCYMKPKALFSVLHCFSKARNKDYYQLVCKDFPVNQLLKRLLLNKHSDLITKISSFIFLLSHSLFFLTIGRF